MTVEDSDGHVEGTSLVSLDGMNATTLRDRVQRPSSSLKTSPGPPCKLGTRVSQKT